MAMMNRRRGAQLTRFTARRTREDDAPRLREEVPTLVSLQLDVEDRSGASGRIKHLRRVMVDHAPALFLLPCGDPKCAGQEHDLTADVLRALRSGETSFQGEDTCQGSGTPGGCPRVLRFEAVASYRPPRDPSPGKGSGLAGGISALFSRPAYQSAVATCSPLGSLPIPSTMPMRQVPDIAFNFDIG